MLVAVLLGCMCLYMYTCSGGSGRPTDRRSHIVEGDGHHYTKGIYGGLTAHLSSAAADPR